MCLGFAWCRGLGFRTPKVCGIVACWAISRGFGPVCYLLLRGVGRVYAPNTYMRFRVLGLVFGVLGLGFGV